MEIGVDVTSESCPCSLPDLGDLFAEEYGDWFVIDWYEENFNLYQNQIGCGGKNGIYLCVDKYQRVFLGREHMADIYRHIRKGETVC